MNSVSFRPFLALFAAAHMANLGSAQFSTCSSDPTPVCDQYFISNFATVESDKAGGAFFQYYAGEANNLQSRLWCQRMSPDGYRMWGDSGRVVCYTGSNQGASAVHGDGIGGYYISWTENRGNLTFTNRFGQHFDPLGNRLWGEEGLYLGEWEGNYADKSACTLADGSMAIALNGSGSNLITHFQACRFLPDGTPSWVVKLDTTSAGFAPTFIADEAGGVFVVWQILEATFIQHIDNQGNKWSTPLEYNNVPLYWCYSKPNGLFVGTTIEETLGYSFVFQEFDLNGTPMYSGNGKKIPVIGYTAAITASRFGGFYVEHLSHLSKVDSEGELVWQTTLPWYVNMGITGGFFLEINTDTVVVAYTGNGMLAFDASGSILWEKNGNPLFSSPFGLTGACATTDGRFMTGQYDPNGAPILMAKKWNADGSPYGLNISVNYTISGPDSISFGTNGLFQVSPDSVATNIVNWLISADSVYYQIIPGSENQPNVMVPIVEDSWLKVVVKRGLTCLDTLGPIKTSIYYTSPTHIPSEKQPGCVVQQMRNTLHVTLATAETVAPSVSIYAMNGNRLIVETPCQPLGGDQYLLPLPQLPSGIYIYQIRTRHQRQAGKIMVHH